MAKQKQKRERNTRRAERAGSNSAIPDLTPAPNERGQRAGDRAAANPLGSKRLVAIAFALVALTWLGFGQASGFPFINYDDPGYVTENADVLGGVTRSAVLRTFTTTVGGNWHPLTMLSHMVD